jgi:hypothetical protein
MHNSINRRIWLNFMALFWVFDSFTVFTFSPGFPTFLTWASLKRLNKSRCASGASKLVSYLFYINTVSSEGSAPRSHSGIRISDVRIIRSLRRGSNHWATQVTILSTCKIQCSSFSSYKSYSERKLMFEVQNWLIFYSFTSRSRIFHLYGDVAIAGEGLQYLGLCSALREGSLSCHSCCDTGPRFVWSLASEQTVMGWAIRQMLLLAHAWRSALFPLKFTIRFIWILSYIVRRSISNAF